METSMPHHYRAAGMPALIFVKCCKIVGRAAPALPAGGKSNVIRQYRCVPR
jgi:hypothetical protein